MFDNRELLQAMSNAAKEGRIGLETHPDYKRPIAESVLIRVKRAAARDHTRKDLIEVMQTELRYAKENSDQCIAMYRDAASARNRYLPEALPWQAVKIERTEVYAQAYESGTNIGEVEVTYSKSGARAIYGVYKDGSISLFAN